MVDAAIRLNKNQCQSLALNIGDYVTVSTYKTVVFKGEDRCPFFMSGSEAYNHGIITDIYLRSHGEPVQNTTYSIVYKVLYDKNEKNSLGASKYVCFSSCSCYFVLNNYLILVIT